MSSAEYILYVNLFLGNGNIFLLGGWKHIFIGGWVEIFGG